MLNVLGYLVQSLLQAGRAAVQMRSVKLILMGVLWVVSNVEALERTPWTTTVNTSNIHNQQGTYWWPANLPFTHLELQSTKFSIKLSIRVRPVVFIIVFHRCGNCRKSVWWNSCQSSCITHLAIWTAFEHCGLLLHHHPDPTRSPVHLQMRRVYPTSAQLEYQIWWKFDWIAA